MEGDNHRTPAGELIRDFAIYGDFLDAAPYGNGHINDTFVSRWDQGGACLRYLHQRINDRVFLRPGEVMENIGRVTAHLAAKAGDGGPGRGPSRRTLTVVPARDGKPWVRDREGGWWRTYLFIEGARSKELTESPEDARFLGRSIGAFQRQLADLPPPALHETIPGFHDMERRYRRFHEVLAKDPRGRAKEAAAEIAFLGENEERGRVLIAGLKSGRLPRRICHNDAKINNILISGEDPSVYCVGDLDTVMPGTILFDTGDLIRTVCVRAAEDERDLARVVFDLDFFRALLEGYLSEAAGFMTREEGELLAESGRNLTQIMALRFLTDYLEGDPYYRCSRPGHNLDRARNQIALIRSMDARWEEARGIAAGERAVNHERGG
jgi:hypothetical protein